MKLSIVIPNYNGERTLEKCLESVKTQKVGESQLILVDDLSTDSSVRLVKDKFPEVSVIENERNFGAARARNTGIRAGKGDLFLFTDSDVYFLDSCLKKMLTYSDEFDIVYPKVLFENGKIFSPASPNEKAYIRRSPAFLITREALDKLDEYFDENYFIYYEDVDFFMRCYLAGLTCRYVPDAAAVHAVLTNGRNLERRFYLEAKNRIYSLIKFIKTPRSARVLLRIPTPRDVLKNARAAFTNNNIYSTYPDHAGRDKLSKSRIKLIFIFLKAVLWNVFNIGKSIRKHRLIVRKYR